MIDILLRMAKRAAITVSSAFVLAGNGGCGGAGGAVQPAAGGAIRIRAFDAVVNEPAGTTVMFAANGLPIPGAVNVSYAQAPSGYTVLPGAPSTLSPATISVVARPGNTALASGKFNESAVARYTYVAFGAAGSSAFPPRMAQFVDTIPTSTLDSNTMAIRLVNLSPDAGTVSLAYATTGQVLTQFNPASNPKAGSTSAPAYGLVSLTLPPHAGLPPAQLAPPTFQIDNSAGAPIPTASGAISKTGTFSTGNAYTVFLVGSIVPHASQPFDAIVVEDYPPEAVPL